MAENEKTAPISSVGADEGQSLQTDCTNSIAENDEDFNSEAVDYSKIIRRMEDPTYIHVLTLSELYNTVFPSKPPIIDGLLNTGVYLFAGASKIGKSSLMAQIAYHVSMGKEMWGYSVDKSAVLYLALEDDFARLQKRLYRMFGEERNDNLMFATRLYTEPCKCQ